MEVYLDNSATTRSFACVAEIVSKVMLEDYGNPSSMHMKGVEAERYIRYAKEKGCSMTGPQDEAIENLNVIA